MEPPWKRHRMHIHNSAAQPAPTSWDNCQHIEECIRSSSAEEYESWLKRNETQRKTWSNLIGHIHCAIRWTIRCSAAQPAPKGIPLKILLGWLRAKFNQHYGESDLAGQHMMESLLIQWAQAEHRHYRMQIMVNKSNDMSEETMSIEAKIDKRVLFECLTLCAKDSDSKKQMLIDLPRRK